MVGETIGYGYCPVCSGARLRGKILREYESRRVNAASCEEQKYQASFSHQTTADGNI